MSHACADIVALAARDSVSFQIIFEKYFNIILYTQTMKSLLDQYLNGVQVLFFLFLFNTILFSFSNIYGTTKLLSLIAMDLAAI